MAAKRLYLRASTVTAFLAATATKVAVYAFIRVVFSIFGGVDILALLPVREALMVLALVGMFAGSAVAIYQTDVKRVLAYSSVAQIGYMILGISFDTVTGVTAGIVHLFNHALMKGGLFLAIGAVAYQIGSVKIADMAGLGKRMPLTMAAFVVGGLSLIGVPLTAGFISKWVPDPGGARARLVASRSADRVELPARRDLRLAHCRGRLLPASAGGRPGHQAGTALDDHTDLGTDRRDGLFRHRRHHHP